MRLPCPCIFGRQLRLAVRPDSPSALQGRKEIDVTCASKRLTVLALLFVGVGRVQADYLNFDVPGGSFTQVTGISGNNVVGTYNDGSSLTHGFLYNGSTFTTLSVPGAINTIVNGVSGNAVVGNYYNSTGGSL